MRLQVLGCDVGAEMLQRWDDLFVPAPAPFYLSAALDLPQLTVMERKDFSRQNFTLSYHDSYRTYAVTPAAQWIAFLEGDIFDALPYLTQQTLLAEQVRLKRGHVYTWDHARKYCQSCEERAFSRTVEVDGTRHFVLDPFVWALLLPEERHQWLIDYISADGSPCIAATLTESHWQTMPYPTIRQLAGTFALESGANCFATTLAAITPSQAPMIASLWLQVDEFLAGVEARGYRYQPERTAHDADLHDAVLIWYAGNAPQHACYLIQPNLVLNKNSQCWYSPRQLLTLTQLREDWRDQPTQMRVYTRDT